MQGWHYELESAEAPLTFKGVVYNEMKGVYSSPESLLERAAQQALFKDNTYGVDRCPPPPPTPTPPPPPPDAAARCRPMPPPPPPPRRLHTWLNQGRGNDMRQPSPVCDSRWFSLSS